MSTTWDAIIVGAGPAGSSAAALLAQAGQRVLVLEKDEFPRFHIGESLLPAAGVVQELLGLPADPDIYLFKRGAQFICERSDRISCFDFAEALPGPPRHAYHVDRPRFDKQLRDRAAQAGAEVRHGDAVKDVEIEQDAVVVQTETGRERGRYLIDASGQSRLMARKFRSVVPYRHFGKAASFTHFEGIGDDTVQDFAPHNDIRIMMVPDGWAWVIPLPGRRLSVGLVSRKQGALRQDSVLDYVRGSRLLSRWTAGADVGETRMIGNFSFRNERSYGPRFACLGDASCFIDPVFSSGVSLGISGAVRLSEVLVPALQEGLEADPELAAPLSAAMEPGYESFCSMVYRFYNTRFVDNVLFGAPNGGDLKPHVISVLAGDVLRPGNRFRDMLLSSKRKPWQGESRFRPEPKAV